MRLRTLFNAHILAHTNWYKALYQRDFNKTKRYGNLIDKLNLKIVIKINKLGV